MKRVVCLVKLFALMFRRYLWGTDVSRPTGDEVMVVCIYTVCIISETSVNIGTFCTNPQNIFKVYIYYWRSSTLIFLSFRFGGEVPSAWE